MNQDKKEYVFFSMRDFTKDGGGSIRMYGILNSLAANGKKVTFISNAKSYQKFHSSIIHHSINYTFSPKEKRKFQFLIGFSLNLVNRNFESFSNILKDIFKVYKKYENIYFFEYLDNSIGYWLYKETVINGYSNDIHGIATLEFKYTYKNSNSFKGYLINFFKYLIAKNLDRKVLSNSKYNIYVSKAMENYFLNLHPCIQESQTVLIPNLISQDICNSPSLINLKLKLEIINNLNLGDYDKVILFAGGFKPTAGVLELIKAFELSLNSNQKLILLLIGDGPSYSQCEEYVNKNNLNSSIYFLGSIPYDQLPTYQCVSDILVCPDQMNEFSDKIIHFKYLDALLANKIVINGNFKSVLEINSNESLSVGFDPSSQNSLNETLMDVIENYDFLKLKYCDTKSYICSHLTYANFIGKLPASK